MVNKNAFYKVSFFILIVCLSNCAIDYKQGNKRAAEKLRGKLVEGKFEEIYDSSKENLAVYITKEEFLRNMNLAVNKMKEFDESLIWEQDETADEHRVREVYSYKDASWRTMEKNGRKLYITIWWDKDFSFCDLQINEEKSNEPEIIVSRCSKS